MAKVLKWERKPTERPHELMDAALRVFAERGYRATTLEEVADAAGVSKSTLYQYFTGKSDLLLQALQHRRRAHLAEFEQVRRELTGPATVRLRLVVRKGYELWKRPEHLDVLRLLLGEVRTEAPEVLREWFRLTVASGWQLIAGLIEEGQAAGEFRRDADAEAIARIFASGFVHQFLLQSQPGLEVIAPFDMERLVDSGLDHLLHGLRPVIAVQPASAPGASHSSSPGDGAA
jgi:AcrR family transcriptional regulator